MSAIPAIIAAIASITAAVLAFWAQNRIAKMQTETQAGIARLQAENQASLEKLKDELQQRKEVRQKTDKAEEVLAKYREPLLQAAYELQSRLFNITRQGLLYNFYTRGNERDRAYTVENTLYVLAQYLAWTEIIRREVQFLDLGEIDSTRNLAKLHERIRAILLSTRYGNVFRVFRGEQRAIGELMIIKQDGMDDCIGYAAFVAKQDEAFRFWFETLRQGVDKLATDLKSDNGRLIDLQNALIELIEYLDPNFVRFDKDRCQKA
ncbi:MAG: hypothetical protein KA368_04770 [Acidobacteria bacterium]|nr:hypothetical protein [Acidobacteriota bacterium]